MDRHEIPGLTAEDVAEGHKQDLKIQHKFNCRALTYWFDEVRGTAFCLIEAPDKKSVHELHENAHGLMPNRIIEVDTNLVEAFLGRIKDPGPSTRDGGSDVPLLREPAFRTVMVAEIKGMAELKMRHGLDGAIHILRNLYESVDALLKRYGGRMVVQNDSGFTASFQSVLRSFRCAVKIQQSVRSRPKTKPEIHTAIGLGAGDPVTGKDELFGDALLLAQRLSTIAGEDQIMVTSSVKNLCRKKGLDMASKYSGVKTVNPDEEKFVTRLMDVTERIWNVEGLKTVELAQKTGLSKSQFYRNLTSLTGSSPARFLREYRLTRAVQLIESNRGNIAQIAFETGFSNPSYFSKCFKKRFGVSPSDYREVVT